MLTSSNTTGAGSMDNASVTSSSALTTHSSDLSCTSTSSSTSGASPFPSIRCNLTSGIYADGLYTCQNNPKLLKKLNFVVCSERTLEIHESERAYRKRKRARTIVDLSSIFSITKRKNDKLDLCLVLMSPEQTFFLRAADPSITNEWYALLISNIHTSKSLTQKRQISYNDFPDAAWDVTVGPRPRMYRKMVENRVENICNKEKRAFGRKRLCFYQNSVVLVQMHSEPGDHMDRDPDAQDPDNWFYFPRAFISHYGVLHKKFFVLKTSTSAFGTCEVVMECESASTASEICESFKSIAFKNAGVEEMPWTSLTENKDDDEEGNRVDELLAQADDDEEDPASRRPSRSTAGKHSLPSLPAAQSYLRTDTPSKKEVRFKTEDDEDRVPVEGRLEKPTAEDGVVGAKIAVDILRLGGKKALGKRRDQASSSGKFTGFIANIKRKLHDMSTSTTTSSPPASPQSSSQDLLNSPTCSSTPPQQQPQPGQTVAEFRQLKRWAENRASLIEEETEDSGGTLKVEDPSQHEDEELAITREQQREKRRAALLSEAVREYQRQFFPNEDLENGMFDCIEMKDLSRLTEDLIARVSGESSACSVATTTDSSASDADSLDRQPVVEDDEDEEQLPLGGAKFGRAGGSHSSTSALDSCISNTSEDFSVSGSSASSSSLPDVAAAAANVPSAAGGKTGGRRNRNRRKSSLDSRSCAGRYTNIDEEEEKRHEEATSDMSVDSCYSSLTNNGYHKLARSHSLSKIISDMRSEEAVAAAKATPSKSLLELETRRLDNERRFERSAAAIAIHTQQEEADAARPTLKPVKSSSDLMSDAQQEALRLELAPAAAENDMATARQRAASLGNKTWSMITPLGHPLHPQQQEQSTRKRHRHQCRKRRSRLPQESTLIEEQPSRIHDTGSDFQHPSISSRSEHSTSSHHAFGGGLAQHIGGSMSSSTTRSSRISHAALMANQPHRAHAEDLAEVVFMAEDASTAAASSAGIGGGSIHSGGFDGGSGIHARTGSDPQREFVQAFGNTNRALIPTTRYSSGSGASSSGASTRQPKRLRYKHRKGYELDTVQCYIAFDNKSVPSMPPRAGSKSGSIATASSTSSSRDSAMADEVPRCRHGKPMRHRHHGHEHRCHSGASSHGSSEDGSVSCRRRHHRSSYQDAIVEEEWASANPQQHLQQGLIPSAASDNDSQQLSVDEPRTGAPADGASQKSEEQGGTRRESTDNLAAGEDDLDRLNNANNPVPITA